MTATDRTMTDSKSRLASTRPHPGDSNELNVDTMADGDAGLAPSGVWYNPYAEYKWGLGPWGSVAAVIALLAVLLAFVPAANRLRNVIITAAITLPIVAGFAIRDKWGRHLYARAWFAIKFAVHRWTGRNMYTSAWFSSTPVTQSNLPGLLSQSSVAEHRPPGESPYAVVHHPASNTSSVLIECHPPGAALQHREVVGARRQAWAAWLAAMSDEPALAAIQVTTEVSKASRLPGLQAIAELSEDVNAVADQIMRETVERASEGNTTRTWVAVGWATERSTRTQLTAEVLPARVERLCSELANAGAGQSRPVDQNELARVWAGMYDPSRRDYLARFPNQVIRIGDAGPVTHAEGRRRYRIGGYDTVSLTLGAFPSASVTTAALERLRNGIDGTVAVRWSELFRPITSTDAQNWTNAVQRGVETRLALDGDRKHKARDIVDDQQTHATAVAIAKGQALIRVGFSVTLTVEADADITGPIERVRNACAPLSPHLRVMDGAHQTSWVATLPAGVPVPEALAPAEGITNG